MYAILALMGMALAAMLVPDPVSSDDDDQGGGRHPEDADRGLDILIAADGDFAPLDDQVTPPQQIGSDGPDFMRGDAFGDLISGAGGDDRIDGLDGDDTLFGGDGDDALFGHEGDDLIYGEDGDDHLVGGNGNDSLFGGAGNDTLEGMDGADSFVLLADSDAVITDFDAASDRLEVEYQGDLPPVLATLSGSDGLTLLADETVVAVLQNVTELDLAQVALIRMTA